MTKTVSSMRAVMKTVPAFLLLAFMFSSCEPAPQIKTAIEPRWLIVPGESIGLIRIGMGMEDAEWMMRRLYWGANRTGDTICNDSEDFCVRGTDKVAMLITGSALFRTSEGLRACIPWLQSDRYCGSTVDQFLHHYGKPSFERKDAKQYMAQWRELWLQISASRDLDLWPLSPADTITLFDPKYFDPKY